MGVAGGQWPAAVEVFTDHSPLATEMTNFIHASVAVLAGNAVYLLLLPHLPPAARHVPLRVDLGLVIDFWLCLVFFGIIKTVSGRRRSQRSQSGKDLK